MAQKETVILDVQTNAAETTQEVDDAIKDLKRSVDDLGDASEQSMDKLGKGAKKAAKDAKEAKEEIVDLKEAGDNLSDGIQEATGLLDEFTDGKASEIKGIADSSIEMYQGFKTFGKGAKAAFAAAKTGANGMKKALISTGIGALVVAVGLLIAYWEDIVDLVTGGTEEMTEAQEGYNAAIEKAQASAMKSEVSLNMYLQTVQDVTAAEEDRLFALDELRKAGIKTEDVDLANAESLQLLNDRVRENIELVFARAKANAAAAMLEEEMTNQLKEQGKELSEYGKWYDGITSFFTGGGTAQGQMLDILGKQAERRSEALAKSQENVNRAKETYKEALEVLVGLEGANLKQQEITRKELERRAKTDDAVAQALRDREEAERRAADMYVQVQKELEVLRAEEGEKEIVRIKQNYEERIAMITAQYGAESQELKDLLELQGAEIQAVRDRQAEDRKAAEEKAAEERIRKEKEEADEKLRIAKELADKEAEIRDSKYLMVQDSFEALRQLSDAFAGESEEQQRRNFAAQKALSAAQVVMGTIEGAQNAFTTANKSPLTAVFPAYPYVQAGLATAFGIAQLKQIQKQQFEGTSAPSSTSAPSASAPASNMAPSFNVVGSSGANVIAESLSSSPIRAYVVGGDVTTQQELDRNRVKSATL